MFKNPAEANIPVILVDDYDHEIGISSKKHAHQEGLLHRAFSVFVKDSKTDRLLLQQRANAKYHSPGLWTNACCGHPLPDSGSISEQAASRLEYEMGIRVNLKNIGYFKYFHQFTDGLFEHEYDHVFVGYVEDVKVDPCPDEVSSYRWVKVDELLRWQGRDPSSFTPWFNPALKCILESDN
jgi:isopentenyl-diphosphate delta-isomerase|tara:strand:+ start:1028 stop:1570 length:543 start_codon:yes stop_codon:yes gene_type:complete